MKGRRSRRAFWERGSRSARLAGAGIVFGAFLAFDLFSIARHFPEQLVGDEWRYLYYAKNLLNGHYSPPERVFLWNGPGYPLFLAPFVAAGAESLARYANAFLHAGGLAYAWLMLRARLPAPWSIGVVLVLGLHPPAREHLPLLLTETLCAFLLTGWAYHALEATSDVARKRSSSRHRLHVAAAGFYLGLLCLTKVVFGPVLAVFVLLCIVASRRFRVRRSGSGPPQVSPLLVPHVSAALIALGLCVPYIAYTYTLTGRVFYWGNAWPNTFYWLTSPFPEETGDWYHQGWVFDNPLLREHHGAFFQRVTRLDENPNLSNDDVLMNLSSLPAADLFLEQGLANLRAHPWKFVSNWCWNWGRLFFDVPVTVRRTPFWNDATKANLPLLVWTAVVVAQAVRTRTRLPRHWFPIGLFAALTLGAYSFASLVARYLVPLVPIWLILTSSWFARTAWIAKLRQKRQARAGRSRAAAS